MSRLLSVAGLYVFMFLGWIGAGLFMLLAPVRFGNLLHDSFGLFPEVSKSDGGKKLIIRLAGAAFLGFAAYFAFMVAALVGPA